MQEYGNIGQIDDVKVAFYSGVHYYMLLYNFTLFGIICVVIFATYLLFEN